MTRTAAPPTNDARNAFLRAQGIAPENAVALPADASPRQYFRLPGTGLLLVQVPPDDPDQVTFARVAEHLNRLGLSAPCTFAADPSAGFSLVEDFGHRTYAAELASGADEAAYYETAIDVIAALHAAPDAATIDLPPYDAAFLLREVMILADWFAPAAAPKLDKAAFGTAFSAAWVQALTPVADNRSALVLRDFHLDNLIHVADRSGLRACGLIDVQGALIGAPEYDLASLLQDARRDLQPGLENAMLARYLTARPAIDRSVFSARYHLLAAQRHAKVAGLFVRLARRDGKPGYLHHLPRVLARLDLSLRAAGLGEIRALLDRHVPGWQDYATATAL